MKIRLIHDIDGLYKIQKTEEGIKGLFWKNVYSSMDIEHAHITYNKMAKKKFLNMKVFAEDDY